MPCCAQEKINKLQGLTSPPTVPLLAHVELASLKDHATALPLKVLLQSVLVRVPAVLSMFFFIVLLLYSTL